MSIVEVAREAYEQAALSIFAAAALSTGDLLTYYVCSTANEMAPLVAISIRVTCSRRTKLVTIVDIVAADVGDGIPLLFTLSEILTRLRMNEDRPSLISFTTSAANVDVWLNRHWSRRLHDLLRLRASIHLDVEVVMQETEALLRTASSTCVPLFGAADVLPKLRRRVFVDCRLRRNWLEVDEISEISAGGSDASNRTSSEPSSEDISQEGPTISTSKSRTDSSVDHNLLWVTKVDPVLYVNPDDDPGVHAAVKTCKPGASKQNRASHGTGMSTGLMQQANHFQKRYKEAVVQVAVPEHELLKHGQPIPSPISKQYAFGNPSPLHLRQTATQE